jgi:Zn finger protein HypA/HybF involved in hydrogenase expression
MSIISFTISIPTDNGFIGRECNNCNKYFKIKVEHIKSEMYCPYCGTLQGEEDFITNKQKVEIDKRVDSIAKRYIEEKLDKMLQDLARGSNIINYRPTFEKPVDNIYNHLEKEVDAEICCSHCLTYFQVFGIFGYCPGCRSDNILIYEANLDLLLQEIELSNNKKRALRHLYDDLVSTFENYCKKVSNKYNLGNTNFQNLRSVKELFKKHGVNIFYDVSDKEKIDIKRVFEKRHAYQHAAGKITEKYIKNVPQDYHLIGTSAELDQEEFTNAINILKKITRNITNKYCY